MVGERITQDVPNNVSQAIHELQPKNGSSLVQAGFNILDRAGKSNHRAFNRTIGTVTSGIPKPGFMR